MHEGLSNEDLTLIAETPSERIFHVLPCDDIREHYEKSDKPCWCRPSLMVEGTNLIIVHNAADGREAFEEGIRKPS